MPVSRSPYSAKVVLRLFVAGQFLALSQVGPSFVVLKDLPLISVAATQGRVDVIIDNRVASSKSVVLPHGIALGKKRVSYF